MNKKLITKWERAVLRLKKVLDEIREKHPEANHYQQEGSMCLLSGPSHDDNHNARTDRVLSSFVVNGSDGGAW